MCGAVLFGIGWGLSKVATLSNRLEQIPPKGENWCKEEEEEEEEEEGVKSP